MNRRTAHQSIQGTTIFDGDEAQKGYALNRMCFSFNDAASRKAFVEDEVAYCTRFGLSAAQRDAIVHKDILRLIELGGHPYYLAKFAGVFGLDMQDIGALQTGLTKDAFQARLVEAGR